MIGIGDVVDTPSGRGYVFGRVIRQMRNLFEIELAVQLDRGRGATSYNERECTLVEKDLGDARDEKVTIGIFEFDLSIKGLVGIVNTQIRDDGVSLSPGGEPGYLGEVDVDALVRLVREHLAGSESN